MQPRIRNSCVSLGTLWKSRHQAPAGSLRLIEGYPNCPRQTLALCVGLPVGTVKEVLQIWNTRAQVKICTDTHTHAPQVSDAGFLTQFLICGVAMEILTVVSPVLLWILLHSAAIWLQLLVQATTVNKYRLAGLSIPSSLTKHLFQLFKCVTALSFPNTMFFHPTVTPAKGLRHKVFCYSFKAVLPLPGTDHRY